MHAPRIAITPGEPAGIGPDICLQLCLTPWPCELVFVADIDLLSRRAKLLNIDITFNEFDPDSPPIAHRAGTAYVLPVSMATEELPGVLDKKNSPYVIETLTVAAQLCLDNVCSTLVTGPVQKSIINDAGIAFTGHTEFFANYCDAYPVMMLQTEQLRVALATTHIPLSKVSETLSATLLTNVINILNSDLKSKFSIAQPRIAVCGLNPHAGEGGHLGYEEIETIIPALENLRKAGLSITGPLPADTIFTPCILNEHDVILGMFHDQVLPTLKYSGFGDAINITLGLPITRTSVDHGTALDLAGTNKTNPNSIKAALNLAINLAGI